MERKLRISHASFEKLLCRFLGKFVSPSLRIDELESEENVANILELSHKVLDSYKSKSFRKHSGYSYRLPETGDVYKMSYTFDKEGDSPKLHFKLHVKKYKWGRCKRIAIMSIRLNENK